MLTYYAYKYRLYPNEQQKQLLEHYFGCNRFVFNYFLYKRQEYYQANKEAIKNKKIKNICSFYNDEKDLVDLKKQENYKWLKEVSSTSLLYTLQHLDTAYKNFFKKQAKSPNYKKKSNNQSFTIYNIRVENGKIYIPKFKEGIRLKEHRKLDGKIRNATVSKRANKYYVSILVEKEIEPLQQNNNAVGIDMGFKDLCILSDGICYENIKALEKQLKKIKYLQKQMNKSKKNSKRRDKKRLKLAILHQKISNKRSDYLHNVTKSITNENQVIVIEDLNVSGMMKNHNLAQSISDCALYELKRQLEYKCKWKRRSFIKIDPIFKICSNCGHINKELTIDRKCSKCNCEIDNNVINAKNILKQGVKKWLTIE